MNEALVYDSAHDAATALPVGGIATICIVVGMALMSVPIVRMIRRQPEKRVRGFAGLGVMALIALGVVFGLPMLEAGISDGDHPETIEGVVGTVSPTLLTVGGMKIMVSCADAARCPGVRTGDNARVAYVEDSGPETDGLATRIWKLSGRGAAK